MADRSHCCRVKNVVFEVTSFIFPLVSCFVKIFFHTTSKKRDKILHCE